MKRAEIGQVVLFGSDGQLMEVIGIGEGRTVMLRPVCRQPCPSCGSIGDVHLLEGSPLFEAEVHPVKTISGEPSA